MEKYMIQKISNCPLFLADRHKTKRYWWTYNLNLAIIFTSQQAAIAKKESLKYGSFRVITTQEAISIRSKADDVHEREMDKIDYMNNYDPGDSEYWDNKD